MAALHNNPMAEADKQVVLKQINQVTDVTRTPGQYLLERTISNIWTSMVFDGTSAQVAVDEAKNDVNKEIVRKMKEIGFYDENGKLIKDGINTLILGRPNVGKSSILNKLIEEDKAIVTSVAGTTRDIVEGQIRVNGILLNIIDTAGVR